LRLASLLGATAAEFLDSPQPPELGLGRDVSHHQIDLVTRRGLRRHDPQGVATQDQPGSQHPAQIGFAHTAHPPPKIIGIAKLSAGRSRCNDS
jgi:hypothetical protein